MITQWAIRPFTIGGSPQTYSDYYGVTRNYFHHSTDRSLEFALNGVDACNFSLYLDDPGAALVRRLKTVIKVWRTVYNDSGGVHYSDSSPCFCGIVTQTNKQGAAGQMQVTAYNPLWRLQSRFHLLNHYLKKNPDTNAPWTQSELMWKLIDLVNNAFGSESFTGIGEGTFSWGDDIVVSPYFVGKGSNTWANIFDDVMNKPSGADIIPEYVHSDGDPTMMLFSTDQKRGGVVGPAWNYKTGSGDNLDDLTEAIIAAPGNDTVPGFANYLWAVGAGGPNSGKIAMEENISSGANSDGSNEIGVYMRRVNRPELKLVGKAGPPPTHLKAVAAAEFAKSKHPEAAYEAVISPAAAGGPYSNAYGAEWGVGDVVTLNANKGALQVSGVQQRIFTATLSLSDAGLESTGVVLSDDFYGKVAS